jgi:hypothetical protein
LDFLGADLPLGGHHEDLLLGDRFGDRPDPELFLPLHNLVKRVVAVRAIFFAGVTGDAFFKDPRLFPLQKAPPFFPRRRKVHLQVLAPGQAIKGLAPLADFSGKFQIIHRAGSFRAQGEGKRGLQGGEKKLVCD